MSVSSETQPHDEQSVLELELEQNREAPSLARAAIAGFSENRDLDAATLATLTLLVSEVVTNAVIHPDVEPPGGIRLSARIAGGVIRVEVTDEGNGFTPQPRDPAKSDRGYGLYLLEHQASAWGVERQPVSTVWFELSC
ncbi:MAG: ATP-binding protein [Solirubrobacteraceae bacterium]